jgi:uncharacterized protein YigE (DUF2233 family)
MSIFTTIVLQFAAAFHSNFTRAPIADPPFGRRPGKQQPSLSRKYANQPIMTLSRLIAGLLALFAAAPAAAACRDIDAAGASYALCDIDARAANLRLFLKNPQGEVYGSFSAIDAALAKSGERLAFATNGGMYDENLLPIGLYVENGETLHPANMRAGAGNFHMKPNGVFFVDGGQAGVVETARFRAGGRHVAFATQSGPMLLVGGRLNPHIHESGSSEKIRNGVCVTGGHLVHFAISNQPVTFHAFAHLFKDRLGCADALFLDGSISSLYAPDLARHDRFRPMGPIIGVAVKK